jgi:DnaJ-class molecular chaperone
MMLERLFIRRLGSNCRRRRAERSFYDILQVKTGATSKEIKSQYFKLCKSLHPDVQNTKRTSMEFVQLTEAYQVLRDARKRREYDASLGLSSASHIFEQNEESSWSQRQRQREQQAQWDQWSQRKTHSASEVEAEAAKWTRLAHTQSRKAADFQKVKDSETKRRADEEAFRTRVYIVGTVCIGYILALVISKHR